MTLSRRRVLEVLGGTLAATTTAACGGPTPASLPANATPPAGRSSAPSGEAPAGASSTTTATTPLREVSFLFTGLNLFLIGKEAVTVAMPKPPKDIASHPAALVVIGGTLDPRAPSGVLTSRFLAGVNLHVFDLAGKRLELTSDAMPAFRVYDDPIPYNAAPTTADQWRSLRWVIDVGRMYPESKLSLKSGWDVSLSDALVSITQGEVMALPASDEFEGLWQVVAGSKVTHEQHMTGGVVWRVGVRGKLNVKLTDLKGGGSPQSVDVLSNGTGPLAGLIMHRPNGRSKMSHLRATEALFDGLGSLRNRAVEIKPAATKPPRKMPGLMKPLNDSYSVQSLQWYLDKLEDGSARCPPASFRTN